MRTLIAEIRLQDWPPFNTSEDVRRRNSRQEHVFHARQRRYTEGVAAQMSAKSAQEGEEERGRMGRELGVMVALCTSFAQSVMSEKRD